MTTPEPTDPARGQHPVIGPSGIPQPGLSSPPPAPPQVSPQAPPQQAQYPQTPYPQTPYPQAGAPYGQPAVMPARTPTGMLSWALGFLIFVLFPFISGIISGVAMAIPYGASAKHGGVARENARSAANWGLTYVAVSVVLGVVHVIALATLSGTSAAHGFFPIGIPLMVYLAVSILHVVLVIVGTVRSSSGKVMRVPFAVPYIRA